MIFNTDRVSFFFEDKERNGRGDRREKGDVISITQNLFHNILQSCSYTKISVCIFRDNKINFRTSSSKIFPILLLNVHTSAIFVHRHDTAYAMKNHDSRHLQLCDWSNVYMWTPSGNRRKQDGRYRWHRGESRYSDCHVEPWRMEKFAYIYHSCINMACWIQLQIVCCHSLRKHHPRI